MAQDAGQAGELEDWLQGLARIEALSERAVAAHKALRQERDALAAQVVALTAELSSGTVGTLTAELADAVQANEQLAAQNERLRHTLAFYAVQVVPWGDQSG